MAAAKSMSRRPRLSLPSGWRDCRSIITAKRRISVRKWSAPTQTIIVMSGVTTIATTDNGAVISPGQTLFVGYRLCHLVTRATVH